MRKATLWSPSWKASRTPTKSGSAKSITAAGPSCAFSARRETAPASDQHMPEAATCAGNDKPVRLGTGTLAKAGATPSPWTYEPQAMSSRKPAPTRDRRQAGMESGPPSPRSVAPRDCTITHRRPERFPPGVGNRRTGRSQAKRRGGATVGVASGNGGQVRPGRPPSGRAVAERSRVPGEPAHFRPEFVQPGPDVSVASASAGKGGIGALDQEQVDLRRLWSTGQLVCDLLAEHQSGKWQRQHNPPPLIGDLRAPPKGNRAAAAEFLRHEVARTLHGLDARGRQVGKGRALRIHDPLLVGHNVDVIAHDLGPLPNVRNRTNCRLATRPYSS